MEFKINKDGCLEIKRAGEWKKQYCKMSAHSDGYTYCDDYCSLFGEPEVDISPYMKWSVFDAVNTEKPEKPFTVQLQLCHKTLMCNAKDFTDERVQDEN